MPTPICVVGTIATEPRYSRTGNRAAYCSFRIASHDRRFDREQGQWIDGEVNWMTISAFRGLAEHANASFAKGDRIIVSGRLRIRKWETEERSGTAVEVEAEALGHDLRWGVSRFTKRTPRPAPVELQPGGDAPRPDAPDIREAGTGDGFVPAVAGSGADGDAGATANAVTTAGAGEFDGSDARSGGTESVGAPRGDGFIPSAA